MTRDYASVIKRRLDDVYKAVNNNPAGPQRERADKDNKATFIVSVFTILGDVLTLLMLEDTVERP